MADKSKHCSQCIATLLFWVREEAEAEARKRWTEIERERERERERAHFCRKGCSNFAPFALARPTNR